MSPMSFATVEEKYSIEIFATQPHVQTGCAMNLTRVVNWLVDKPCSKTRLSPFLALAAKMNSPTASFFKIPLIRPLLEK